MFDYRFQVPAHKKIRVIVHTDCKNEADDQFALAHHLMTPKFQIKGVIAGHFDGYPREYGHGNTMEASYNEVHKVLGLMGLNDDDVPIYKGAKTALENEEITIDCEGARFIIEEAMKDDPLPLYAVFQGSLTDMASALLLEPEIAKRMTVIWIGGGKWPVGGMEFNLWQDINAANVVFSSDVPLWQIPSNVYKMVAVTLAELQYRVYPHGEIGKYLFEQMVEYNVKNDGYLPWPHGESWGLGDQPTVTVLLEEDRNNYEWRPAPRFSKEMYYIHDQPSRPIRVYHTIDSRFTLEDFYAKLAINYGGR